MNKKLIVGALALTATASLGLAGCGDEKDKDNNPPAPKTYTVTFDHDNNPDTQNYVIEYDEGATALDGVLPAVPENAGFAGVWDTFTLNDSNITVTAKYGDGSQENPFLVSTATQFKRILQEYATAYTTTYIDANNGNAEVTESEGKYYYADHTEANVADLTKVESYRTVAVKYSWNASKSNWVRSSIEVTNTTYFKLIADIDLSEMDGQNLSGSYFSGVIDGRYTDAEGHVACHTIKMSSEKLANGSGALFTNVVNASIKNIKVELNTNITSLFGDIFGGTNEFNNIEIVSKDNKDIFVGENDNNESPFMFNASTSLTSQPTSVKFTSCKNYVNFISTAPYFGVFVGGFARPNTTIDFTLCQNYGDIVSSACAGIYFGNNTDKPSDFTIEDNIINCENFGTITSKGVSHILAPGNVTRGFSADVIDDLDDATQLVELESKYTASVIGSNIAVANTTALDAGNYQLILTAMASSNGNGTVQTNIKFELEVDGTSNVAIFTDANYGMIDLNTYKSENPTATIPADESTEWKAVEGYNIRYFLGNGYFVVDFAQFEEEGKISSPYVLKKDASAVSKLIVARDAENNIIDFVVDMTTPETDVTQLVDIIDQIGPTEDVNGLTGIHAVFRVQPMLIMATYNGNAIDLTTSTLEDYDGEGSGVTAYQYLAEFDSVDKTAYDANPVIITCLVNGTCYQFGLTTDLEYRIYDFFI